LSRRLPLELREFILRHSLSPAALAVLLHIQAHPDRTWTPRELHLELPDLEEWQAADLLAAFYSQDLLAVGMSGRYQYGPKSPKVARLVATLAQACPQDPAAILEATKSSNSTPLRRFADAVIVKKKRKDR
jgi:hypothetical protein